MSVLSRLRQELVTTLAGLDLNLYTHVPGRLALPGGFVMAGSPYIEQELTFATRTVRFDVIICTPQADNATETGALDTLIGAALALLETEGWLVEQVSQPYQMAFNNSQGLVAAITVTTPTTFTQGEYK
ncbi:MAG: hypothetical protein B5766_12925 [Candidatus Lumbricidophila eiseniae]|uniref:DUF3168 domain-containing protein n=1 Tax=Candidatus Lumbricidiphila eiseniae TaxID=1969409 RepID=A0A2A6FMZ6_9MICO|nr:MAG: hypothetical protein B5766_12925 [Candidatus Lumbricidophila eiseniae]